MDPATKLGLHGVECVTDLVGGFFGGETRLAGCFLCVVAGVKGLPPGGRWGVSHGVSVGRVVVVGVVIRHVGVTHPYLR